MRKIRKKCVIGTGWLVCTSLTLCSGLDALWKDCRAGECFKVVGPSKNLKDLEDICSYYRGQLFSVGSYEEMEHIQTLFEKRYNGILLVGAQMTFAKTVGFLDGSRADGIEKTFNMDTSLAKKDDCVLTKRSNGNTLTWSTTSCTSRSAELYSVCQHEAPEHGFCYEVRWEEANGKQRKQVLEPITAFPATHPKVANKVCGVKPFNYIPPFGLWSTSGDLQETSSTCETASGGELFYAYNYPIQHSSNTGYSRDNTLTMFFVVDTDFQGYWVVVIDSPDGSDADNGELDLAIDGMGLQGKNVQVLHMDDDVREDFTETCTLENLKSYSKNHGPDCYSWDSSQGQGRFVWRWNKCCTDGMVLGSLPSNDFCLNVQVKHRENLNQIRLGDYKPQPQQVEFYDIPITSALSVCGYECPDFCSRITSCGECSNTKGCGWCPTNGCEPIGAKGGCASGWIDMESDTCCKECETPKSCEECVNIEGCGWDKSLQSCTSGNKYSGVLCKREDVFASFYAFDFAECRTTSPTSAPSTSSPTVRLMSDSPTVAPVFFEPTQSPSKGPTEIHGDAQTTPSPSSSPSQKTISPTLAEREAPNQSNATGPDGSTESEPDNGNGGWIAWGIPVILLVLLLSCGCCFFLVAGYKRRRRRDQEENGVGMDIGPALATSPTAVDFAQKNPMYGDLQLQDKASNKPKTNELVKALMLAKKESRIIHLFTNNPGIAMELSKKGGCFVRCTRDSGVMIDELRSNGVLSSIFQLAMQAGSGKRSPKVKTDLKIVRKDEWTPHVDPSTNNTFYYNGKHNEVEWDASLITVKKSPKQDPLRWEFAPDEFDTFDTCLEILRGDNWSRRQDLHIDYFENQRTKERVWLE